MEDEVVHHVEVLVLKVVRLKMELKDDDDNYYYLLVNFLEFFVDDDYPKKELYYLQEYRSNFSMRKTMHAQQEWIRLVHHLPTRIEYYLSCACEQRKELFLFAPSQFLNEYVRGLRQTKYSY